MEACAYIGLGSNQGDRELRLLTAVAELGKLPGTRVTGLSHFYQTEPVGDVPQDDFYNAVARIATTLPPHELLEALKRLEVEVFKRKPSLTWGPRTMDFDILLYGDLVSSDERLTIPHPRLAERRFVLVPLAELAPSLVHPVLGRSIAELLAAHTGTEKVVRI